MKQTINHRWGLEGKERERSLRDIEQLGKEGDALGGLQGTTISKT